MNRPMLTVSGLAVEAVASDGSVVLNVPIALKLHNGRRVVAAARTELTLASCAGATSLQLALGRGHRRLRMLETGEAASMCDIARDSAMSGSSVFMPTLAMLCRLRIARPVHPYTGVRHRARQCCARWLTP